MGMGMGMMSRGVVGWVVDGIELDSNGIWCDLNMNLAFYMSIYTDENVVGYATLIGFYRGVEHVYRCGQRQPCRTCRLRPGAFASTTILNFKSPTVSIQYSSDIPQGMLIGLLDTRCTVGTLMPTQCARCSALSCSFAPATSDASSVLVV